MGTQRVPKEVKRGPISRGRVRSVVEGDFGYWVEETLFGFRISCSPASPHELNSLIGVRVLRGGEQVHYGITRHGYTRITPSALTAAARDLNPSLTSLRLTHAEGHVTQLETSLMLTGEDLEEHSPAKNPRKRARMAHRYEEEEEGSGDDVDCESDEENVVGRALPRGKLLKRKA